MNSVNPAWYEWYKRQRVSTSEPEPPPDLLVQAPPPHELHANDSPSAGVWCSYHDCFHK